MEKYEKEHGSEEGRATRRIKEHMNQHYTLISVYVIVTAVVIFALFRVGSNLPVILDHVGSFFQKLGKLLTPLIAGFVIAYLVFPLVGWLQKQFDKVKVLRNRRRGTRGLAVAATALLVAVGMILGLSVMISAVTHELSLVSFDSITDLVDNMSSSLKSLYASLQTVLQQLNISSKALNDFANSITQWLGGWASNAGTSLSGWVSNITGFFANGIFAIIFAIYFLLDYKGLESYWNRVSRALLPRKADSRLHTVINDADKVFSGYIRGQLIDAAIMAVVISITLGLLNVKFAVLIGILTGIGNLIPYVGPVFAYTGTVLATLSEGNFKKMIIGVILIFVITTLDGNVLEPKLLSSSISVHPMLVIAALLIGGSVGGVFGMLLAVPVAALLKLWFDRLVALLMKRRHIE